MHPPKSRQLRSIIYPYGTVSRIRGNEAVVGAQSERVSVAGGAIVPNAKPGYHSGGVQDCHQRLCQFTEEFMQKLTVSVFTLFLAVPFTAVGQDKPDSDDDTLRFYLSKSEAVVVGKVTDGMQRIGT